MTPREMTPADRAYVEKTWVLESRAPRSRSRRRKLIAEAIADSRCVVLATGDTVHAFAVASGGTLHFVYVPFELRGKGLGRRVVTALLGSYPDRIDVSHPWPFASTRYLYARKAA